MDLARPCEYPRLPENAMHTMKRGIRIERVDKITATIGNGFGEEHHNQQSLKGFGIQEGSRDLGKEAQVARETETTREGGLIEAIPGAEGRTRNLALSVSWRRQ